MTTRSRRHVTRTVSYNATGLDDFPTPPWATRALFHYVVDLPVNLRFIEPACGRGYMSQTLVKMNVGNVASFDVKDYGYGYGVADYCDPNRSFPFYDVLVTNPPYKFGIDFVLRGLKEAEIGVALLVRTLWSDAGRDVVTSRYNRLFRDNPPNKIALICGRMPAAKGRVVRKRAVFVSHSWFWWDRRAPAMPGDTRFVWIPPSAQKELEQNGDYNKKDFLRPKLK